MSWKNISEWLKGGIILLAISLVLEIIDYAAAFLFCPEIVGGIGCILPTRILEIPALYVLNFLTFGNFIPSILITLLFYFIVGALIGFMISKLKSKQTNIN